MFIKLDGQIGYGIGFGSFEALIIGSFTLIGFVAVLLFPSMNPSEIVQYFLASNAGMSNMDILINAFFAVVERLSATMIQVFSVFLIFIFAYSKEKRFLLSTISLKVFIDVSSAYLIAQKYPDYNVVLFYLSSGLVSLYLIYSAIKTKNLNLFSPSDG